MAISPINSGLNALSALTQKTAAAEPTADDGFGDMITRTIQEVSAAEATADRIAVGIAAGEDENVHELLIASSKATLGVELLTQVRNRAVEAYQEIMRMQV